MSRVLIVDDQPHITRVVKTGLSSSGHSVRVANNGLQALEAVRAEMPDAILSDIEMPQMSGMEMCEILFKEFDADEAPYVFLISGLRDTSMDNWLEQFDGKVRFYEKPVSMAKMRELLADTGL